MKTYLFRHGDYDSSDSRQPLSLKGIQDVENVAWYLKGLGLCVFRIWHSPKLRAAQTADILKEIFECMNVEERENLTPNAHPQEIIQDLESQEEDVLIVSHLPFIPRMVSRLTGEEEVSSFLFPTASVAILDFSNGVWQLEGIVTPEVLGS